MGGVGLVLGGGGVLGQAFHAGVLEALAQAGWDPRGADVILGTSAGSQIGALLRAGVAASDLAANMAGEPLSAEGARLLAPVRAAAGIPEPAPAPPGIPRMCAPRLLARLAARPSRARLGLVIAAVAPEGRRSTERLVASLEPLFGDEWPPRALWITAACLDTGERVVFGRPGAPVASVGEAVAASCAVPGFFAPVAIGGVRYVDGGCYSPTNLELLAGAGLEVALVCSPLSMDGRMPRPGVALPARVLHRLELEAEAARVRRSGAAVLAFQPDRAVQAALGRHPMDYSRCAAVVAGARDMARRRLAGGELDALVE